MIKVERSTWLPHNHQASKSATQSSSPSAEGHIASPKKSEDLLTNPSKGLSPIFSLLPRAGCRMRTTSKTPCGRHSPQQSTMCVWSQQYPRLLILFRGPKTLENGRFPFHTSSPGGPSPKQLVLGPSCEIFETVPNPTTLFANIDRAVGLAITSNPLTARQPTLLVNPSSPTSR